MFTLPQIVSVPLLNSLGSGTMVFPTVGIVLAWFMVAALVGAGLGILRQAIYGAPTATRSANDTHKAPSLDADHAHQEAA